MRLPSGGAVHVEGPLDADPVLFLHGAAGGAWSWRPQRAALASSWHLFTWEARGHGSAERVRDAGLADYYVDAREAIATVIDLTRRPAFVVGHSLGALLSLALACDVGAGVKGLFLVDPLYLGERGELALVSAAAAPVMRALCGPLLYSFGKHGGLGRAVTRWSFERMFEDRTRMEEAWADQRAQVPVEYPRLLREALGEAPGLPLREFAEEIAAPTFVVDCGRNRRERRLRRSVEILQRRLGENFHYEVIAGGHYLQLDRPDAVNARLRQFVTTYGHGSVGGEPARVRP